MDVLQEIWEDYKKIIIIVGISIFAVIIIAIICSTLYNPVKISFTGDDAGVIAMESSELKLGATASNKKGESFELNWQVSAGTLNTTKGGEVTWQLPKDAGTYTIAVKAGDKSKVKNVTILENQLGDISLQSKDNINYIDSDSDGLSNVYEKEVSNTEELNADTDNDLVNDGNEVVLGLKPNSKESNSSGEQDDEVVNKYILKDDTLGVNVELKGKDNLASTTVDVYDLNTINEISGIISKVYNVKTEGSLTNATITIKYDKSLISKRALNESQLSLYKLDTENNKFIKQTSQIDLNAATVSATVTELGKFFIADSSNIKEKVSTDLMFVIDNSGSMYSSDIVDGSEENDTQFKRVDLSNSIIDKLKGDYNFGAGKFTFEYSELIGMTNDKEKVKEKINSIKTETEKFSGTYIGNALEGGLTQFNTENKGQRKYMILLTDGKDTTDVSGYDKDKIKNAVIEAKNKGVKVFTIGLGKEIDSEVLQEISSNTNGKYYYASSSEVLDDVFELIAADINYSFVDIDQDSNDDYIILQNNGFLAKQNGMPIENFSTTTNNYGATYGMSLFSKLYFENKLPNEMADISVKNKDSNEIEKAQGYSLKINSKSNESFLSDYELDDLYFMKTIPKDFMSSSISNGILYINDKYKKEINNYGFSYYYLNYNDSNSGFKKYENYIINNDFTESEDKKSTNSMSDDDKELINAIYRLDILKNRDERISFETDPDKAYKFIFDSIQKGEVPVLILNDSYSVAVEKILVNINDSNKFKLEIYDSNYGDKRKFIDLERTKIYNTLEKNNSNKYQYKFTYNDKKVSVSVSIPNIDTNL